MQIFASMFSAVLLQFFPGLMSYRMFALILAVVSFIVIFVELPRKNIAPDRIIVTGIFGMMVLGLYVLTEAVSPVKVEQYNSYVFVLAGQIFPSIVCAAIVAQSGPVQSYIKRYSTVIALLFTMISTIAVFFPTGQNRGGFISNENGLNYQAASYMAAYASGFSYYYLLNYKTNKWPWLFRNRIYEIIIIGSICVNLLTILLSGGRGGLVLFGFMSISAGIYYLSAHKFTFMDYIWTLLFVACVAGLVLTAIHIAENSTLDINGFKRFTLFLQGGEGKLGRESLMSSAIAMFLEKPVFGYGIGSVFSQIGFYSHNIMTDALLEGGIVGMGLLIGTLIYALHKAIKLIRHDSSNLIWVIIMMDGLVMSMFSGYYLAHIPLYWGVAFLLNFNLRKCHQRVIPDSELRSFKKRRVLF